MSTPPSTHSITLIAPASFKSIPWKNGKGVTQELAISQGGTLQNFDWRLSVASVSEDGPFSDFSGYLRHLFLIEGTGITLNHSDGNQHHLTQLFDYAVFDGGVTTNATLSQGPIRDLNLMTKHHRYQILVQTSSQLKTPDDLTTPRLAANGLALIYNLSDADSLISYHQFKHSLPAQHLAIIESKTSGEILVTGQQWVALLLNPFND